MRTSPSCSSRTNPCTAVIARSACGAAALASGNYRLPKELQLLLRHQEHLVGRLGCRVQRAEVEEKPIAAAERHRVAVHRLVPLAMDEAQTAASGDGERHATVLLHHEAAFVVGEGP